MTERQRIEREVLRRRNLARRVLLREIRRQLEDEGLTPTGRFPSEPAMQRIRVRDPLARARAARRGWQGPKPEPVSVILDGAVRRRS